MKRYLLFAGSNYYPIGGWDDFRESFDSAFEAAQYAASHPTDWYHIVDSATGKRV